MVGMLLGGLEGSDEGGSVGTIDGQAVGILLGGFEGYREGVIVGSRLTSMIWFFLGVGVVVVLSSPASSRLVTSAGSEGRYVGTLRNCSASSR